MLKQSIPRPGDFKTYLEYESALIKWKDTIDQAIVSAQIVLPTPQGRHFYRPPFYSRGKFIFDI